MIDYLFVCPKCGNKTVIQMRISEYRSEGHICKCGSEMIRDPGDFSKTYQIKCDGFYAEHPSGV